MNVGVWRRTRTRPLWQQAAVWIGLALVLTVWQHSAAGRERARACFPERLASALAWPLERAFSWAGSSLQGFVTGLTQYRRLVEENRRLRAEKEELAAQKLRLLEAEIENRRLRRLLGFVERERPRPAVARVVALNFGVSRKRLTIRAEDGRPLEVNSIVRTEAGLVGRITEVMGDRAYVFPLIDAEHAVAAVIQRPPRDQGMVHAARGPEYESELLVMDKWQGRADVREGDIVLTSGLGGVYPPGIPIGTVVRVRRASVGSLGVSALIRPFVDFQHLTYVLVERYGG